mgnify:CR=1 FL=1
MSNPRNALNLMGRIPSSDKFRYEFKENENESHNLMYGTLSVRRAYKPKDEQYYQEDLLPFKAFGKTASFMHQYIKRGDEILVSGEMRVSDSYEKDGKTEYETVREVKTLNSMVPIWRKNKNELTDEDYNNFHVFRSWLPWERLRNNVVTMSDEDYYKFQTGMLRQYFFCHIHSHNMLSPKYFKNKRGYRHQI